MEPVVGIDLGTTNSEVAVVEDGRPRILEAEGGGVMPSCVGLDAGGQIIVGAAARNQYAVAPERTVVSIKRLMGSGERVPMGEETYAPQEISAFILKALKERAEKALDTAVSKAVITVPAYFADAQRQATREAGQMAGLEVLRIINEPTAAALAYEGGAGEAHTILVYDLGGGTFDVSVVRIEQGVVEVLASTGDTHLGGDDFDALILDWLNKHMAVSLGLPAARSDPSLQARLRHAAEAAKIALSTAPHARLEEDHVGVAGGQVQHLTYDLYRRDLEEGIEAMLGRTMESVSSALREAGVGPGQLDRVLLVGGSTLIPRVSELLRERLGQEPHGEVDPHLCVALGAALQGGMEMGLEVGTVLVDVTPYTFGTAAVGEVHGRPHMHQFVPLIRRNTRLPASRSDLFYTMHEGQEAVSVEVYQGEDPDALNNVKIGEFLFEGLNRESGAQGEGILLTYALNLDGILEVRATERRTGREIRGVVDQALGQSTPDELRTATDRVEALWQGQGGPGAADRPSPGGADSGAAAASAKAGVGSDAVAQGDGELPAEVRESLERAAEVLDRAIPEDREEILALMRDLREAVRGDRGEVAAELKDELDEILFFVE